MKCEIVNECGSQSELKERLERSEGRALLLGADAEAPGHFYIEDFDRPGEPQLAIGIIASGFGIKPIWVAPESGGFIAVGIDQAVDFIETANGAVASSLKLDGVFLDFIELPASSDVVVISEFGAIRVDPSGCQQWHVETSLLDEWELMPDGILVLREFDEDKVHRIDVASGDERLRSQ